MADPVTNNYSLVLPQVGGDTNVWGGILNNGVIQGADNALGGIQAIAITSADVTLTASQFANAIFVVTGALTANRNLIIPLSPNSLTVACAGRFVVVNNTTAAFNLTVKTVAGGSVGVVVPQGFTAFLYSDGTNVGFTSNGLAGFAQSVSGNPNGQIAGTAGSANTNASLAFDYANGNFWICTTTGTNLTAVWSQPALSVKRGFDTAINLRLNATANSPSANLLTLAVKAADTGLDATASDPITVYFQNPTGSSGAPVSANITGALSINTNAVGASFGSLNNVPFRLWIVLFYNNGSPLLGLINCSTAAGAKAPDEAAAVSATAMTGGATSPGVFYIPNGTALAGGVSVFRIIGYLTYETPLVTAGSYNNAPDVVRLFGPGVKKPGDIIQTVYAQTTTPVGNGGGIFLPSNVTASITPASKANLVSINAAAWVSLGAANNVISALVMRRGTSINVSPIFEVGSPGIANGLNVNSPFVGVDAPGSVTATTYTLYFNSSGTSAVAVNSGTIVLQEIMG